MRVLGLDFGTTAIGVAVGDTSLDSARPLAVVAARDGKPDWSAVDALISEWNPARLIVGLPIPNERGSREILARAERFMRRVKERYQLPCEGVDEHLSSAEARERAKSLGRKADERVDDLAAQVILETWMHR